ncbi:MAG: OmpA family protein [Saprospiraceae bacterium]|nr:OmpA family protein [Saprospiraceae bacterium]
MRKLIPLVLLAMCLQAPIAHAQTRELRDALYAKLNLIDYGQLYNNDIRLGQGFEVAYFRNIAPFVNVGVPLKVGLAKLPNETDNVVTTSADFVLQLANTAPDAKVQPFLAVGAGYVLEQFKDGYAQFPFGVGLNFRTSKYAYFHVQGEYRKAMADDRDNVQLAAGFMTLLHKSPPKVVPPPDRDKDGTPDQLDRCPDLPGPAVARGCPDGDNDGLADTEDECPTEPGAIELRGCPDGDSDGVADKNDSCPTEAGPADNKGCPLPKDTDGDGMTDDKDLCPTVPGTNNGCPDTDGDGLADNFDKCPTVAGLPQNDGCPDPDTDGDGVVDKLDKCPLTPGLATNFGCPEIKQETKERLAFVTKAVQFETAKAVLKNQSYVILDELLLILKEYPDYKLSIEGHTDNVGDEARNLGLSTERAKACYDYLIFKGIKPERLGSIGYGEARPITDNKTAAGRELNRRVEFQLILE